MPEKRTRRFELVDAMILLAATAIGIAWCREDLFATFLAKETPLSFRFHDHDQTRPMEFADRVRYFTYGTSHLLACWTLATLILRLRPPRPRQRRLVCQPGTLAMATATAYALAVAASFVLAYLIRAKYRPAWSDYAGQAIDGPGTAQAIAAAWLILALSGCWRSEPAWPERLGFLLGLAWIVLMAAGNLFDWTFHVPWW